MLVTMERRCLQHDDEVDLLPLFGVLAQRHQQLFPADYADKRRYFRTMSESGL